MIQHYPTILVSIGDTELRSTLVQQLQQEGYLVLEAADNNGALEVARTHSRAIDLILIHTSTNHGVLASALKQYRRESTIFLITERNTERLAEGVLTPQTVLPRVRAFFRVVDIGERSAEGQAE